MADFEEFKFIIPAYSPETMPLDRLIEYLQQISAVIGDPANLHLVKIEHSSTAPIFKVPRRAALQATERAAEFNRGGGTREQNRAYDRLRCMVRRDAPEARRPAELRSERKVLLEIPAAPAEEAALSGLRQATTIDGVLVSIGGVSDAASLRIQSIDGKIISGLTANRAIAKEIAKLIYEPIRVTGTGIWGRSEDGVWGLERMQVQSYELLDGSPMGSILAELRAAKVDWPADADARLAAEREGAA